MKYLVSIGSQFKQYNELDLALCICDNADWNILSCDANSDLFKYSEDKRVERVCTMFDGQSISKKIKLENNTEIYIYDLISCAGIFKPAIELIQLLHKNNPTISIYYRHGNTLYSEHPEEFSIVNKEIILNYPEFLNNVKLSKCIILLYDSYKKLSLKTNKPISYYFMQRLWEMKRLSKQPFNINRFIEYLAYIELNNIANTFINIKEGILSNEQKNSILKKIYSSIYANADLIRK